MPITLQSYHISKTYRHSSLLNGIPHSSRNTYVRFTQKVYTSRAKLIYLSSETYMPFARSGLYGYSPNGVAVVWEPIRPNPSQSEPIRTNQNQSESIGINRNQSEPIGLIQISSDKLR